MSLRGKVAGTAGYQPPNRIVGVDFSAASRDAGRNTWIAEGTVEAGNLRTDRLADVATTLECDPDRASILDAIEARRRNVAALSKAGVDFGKHEDYALASDDALDAVAAAYATYEATRDRSTLEVPRERGTSTPA